VTDGAHLWDLDRTVSPALVNQAPCLTPPSSAVAGWCCGWYSSSCSKKICHWQSGVSKDQAEKRGGGAKTSGVAYSQAGRCTFSANILLESGDILLRCRRCNLAYIASESLLHEMKEESL
jgi:hypothetical protein